jgi:two-component system chemotaxis sensor kinase CheA
MPVTAEAVTLILFTIDRIKDILHELEATQQEPSGTDGTLIGELERMVQQDGAQPLDRRAGSESGRSQPPPTPHDSAAVEPAPSAPPDAKSTMPDRDKAVPERPEDQRPDKAGSPSIRVNLDTLERLMIMVSELVLTRNQLLELVRRHEDSEFKVPLQRLSNVTAELQEGVMKTRMQPIGHAWQKLPRMVRDLSVELGKDIELETFGADTELDRQVLDLIKDPLAHLVRNCADHGIEGPAERLAAGKLEKGTIRLSAYHEGGYIIIEVADDGRGLDTERIKARAVATGFASEAEVEKMTEAQIQKIIFAPGFSTATRITTVSGRGVGMDVVRNNIEQIGGSIDLKSVPRAGTTFIIRIPLTLAIVSALIVEAGGHRFAIPQLSVIELVRARSDGEHRIERIKNTPVLRLRDRLLPLVHLKALLKIGDAVADDGFVVVMQVGSQVFGVVVDGVFHTEEIVIKPLSSTLRQIAMFSGNTILGDGSVIMIVDPNGIAHALGAAAGEETKAVSDGSPEEGAADEHAVSLLVFRAGSPQPKAVPLSLVTRLEEIDSRALELSNGRYLVQYRGQLMPLVRIEDETRLKSEGPQPVLVFSDGGRAMGLAVDEIVDIVEERLDIQLASDRPGVLGSAVINGSATEIIDIGHFLPLAFEDWFRRKSDAGARTATTVLLVDDSAFFRDMLAAVLKAAGYRAVAVPSAADALGLLKAGRRFDVVVTDIDMPEMNGFEFTQALRDNPRTAAVPVVALASMVSSAAIERGREVGFHDIVAKFDRPGLIAAIKEHCVDFNEAA